VLNFISKRPSVNRTKVANYNDLEQGESSAILKVEGGEPAI
jgi:hypothetical protein